MAPLSGAVHIAGQSMDGRRRRDAARMRQRHIGSVFQHGELLPALTPLENVIVPALLAGVPAAEASARGRELLEAVGVATSICRRTGSPVVSGNAPRWLVL